MNLKTFSILNVSLAAWQEVVEWEKTEQWNLGPGKEAGFRAENVGAMYRRCKFTFIGTR